MAKQRDPAAPPKAAGARPKAAKRAAEAAVAAAQAIARPRGRQTIRTPEIIDEILERISAGESLRGLCSDDHMPAWRTVMDWLRSDPDFAAAYASAREAQGDVMDDRIMEVAEAVRQGAMDPQAGRVVLGAYQWRAERLAPRVYGSVTNVRHSGGVAVAQIEMDDDHAVRAANAIIDGVRESRGG